MNEVLKYFKLLETEKFNAGPGLDTVVKGKGKKLWLAEDLAPELMKRGAHISNAFGLAQAVIEEFHRQKAQLRKHNETVHKSRYMDTLESEGGIIVSETNSEQLYLTNLDDWHSTKFKWKQLVGTCKAAGMDAAEIDAFLHSKLKPALFEYSPYTFEKLFSDDKDDFFNTFKPPSHFFNFEEASDKWPAINDFFNHLFIDRKDLDYVYDWLSRSLYKKNNVFLLFPAAKGIGKNFFAERILRLLYGTANYSSNRNEDIKSKFNSRIANNQLSMVDEFTMENDKDEDAIKVFTNEIMTVEEKFQARETKKITCNILLFTNRLDALRLGENQRRFSIIQLTDLKLDFNKPLMHKYSSVDGLGKAIEADIPAFYKFLRNREISRNMNLPYIDKVLQARIHLESERGWEGLVRDQIEDLQIGDSITIEDVQQTLEDQRKTVNVSKIIKYLRRLELCEVSPTARRKDAEVKRV